MSDSANTIASLEAALRARAAKQAVIANNIANLRTPGYRRRSVRFESLLAEVLESHGRTSGPELRSKLAELAPEVFEPGNTPVGSNGNDVSLDAEIGAMVKNDVMYKAYLRILSRAYKKMQAAIGNNATP